MNQELLSVLSYIEQEKGIDREVLLEAVESAIATACRKTLGLKDKKDVSVKIDRETGNIKIYSKDKLVTSGQLGRIAAQTAKQVIIQKIREAERNVVYNEYESKTGELISGIVHRIEKGTVMVDLGKTEGIIPKSEQVRNETYKQGERIRAYIIEVKKISKGPQIILSRRRPELVKKLFEWEVPEIYDHIVEIKAIAREPGERSKIAVYSKDEKVDSVGACVGMRGSRVKNIVDELRGEKIDIIRWSDDIKEFIKQALSPAEISRIEIDKKKKWVLVIVKEDQLSLAIGKHGQNVRLASILTGWEIDIRTEKDLAEKKGAVSDIGSIRGVGKELKNLLKKANYKTIEQITEAKVEDLTKLPKIGKKLAEKLIKEAQKITKKQK